MKSFPEKVWGRTDRADGSPASGSGSSQLTPLVGERDHVRGPADAPLTLVEYGDYECYYCGLAYPIVKRLQEHFGDKLHFAFRNFPIEMAHPHARRAAEAAEAAASQARFWEMHDLLFEHQQELGGRDLVRHAATLGLDVERFRTGLAERWYIGRVEEDLRSGDASGVPGTPTFFINGSLYGGSYDFDTLLAAIEQASKTA